MANEPQSNSQIEKVQASPLIPVGVGNRGLVFTQYDELARFAGAVVAAGLAPKGLEKPQAVLVAIQKGAELGLSPMKSLECIAVINGRAVIFGDAPLAICMACGQFDHGVFLESEVGKKGTDSYGYAVTVGRKGAKPHTATFTVADAKQASLWGKTGPWSQYPDRMLKARARSFALRDTFPDVLGGIGIREEVEDITVIDNRPAPATTDIAERASTRAKEIMEVQEIEVETASAT